MSVVDLSSLPELAALQEIGRLFYQKNWSLATSSNYSVVIEREPLRLLMTASGKDKRNLSAGDFLMVDEQGSPEAAGDLKPSAETMLHIAIAKGAGAGAVLHTHSVWSTLLSDVHEKDDGIRVAGFEMLKALAGVTSHEHELWIPILENSQDIETLAETVCSMLLDRKTPLSHAFILRRHGLYTWGRSLAEARRHVEAVEFLLEVKARRLSIGS
jgi:methylthioribulose-1-phosphate dehydratase